MSFGLSRLSFNRADESFGSLDSKNQLVNFFGNLVYLAVGDGYDSSAGTLFPKLSNQLSTAPVPH